MAARGSPSRVRARIWQITYKPSSADLLWNNPEIVPARQPAGSCYHDVWSGGWDELFPNDEVATIDGNTYPDHGELWTGEWVAETFEEAQSVEPPALYQRDWVNSGRKVDPPASRLSTH